MSNQLGNLEFLLLKTIEDFMKTEVKDYRDETTARLLEIYEDTGSKSFSVKLPDGTKVATFSLAEPKAKDKIDDDKVIDWLEENGYGDQVLTREVPAHEVKSLKSGFLGAIDATATEDGYYVTPAGEIVEGIQLEPAGDPTNFRVTYEGGNEGRYRVIDAWRSGELGEIAPGTALPQITEGKNDDVDAE